MPLTDTTIIHRHGRYGVLSQRYEVLFADGSAVELHEVQEDGYPRMFLRALVSPDIGVCLFDLRQLCKEFDEDLRSLPARDAHGVVFYTLRSHFKTGTDFHRRVGACQFLNWSPAPIHQKPLFVGIDLAKGADMTAYWPALGERAL